MMLLKTFLLGLFSLVLLVSCERCQDEEPLPTSLEFNNLNDFHLHGEFKTNFSSINTMAFTIKETSYFRIAVNELKVADVDILLMQGYTIIGHSMNIFEEEMIADVLQPGNYSIQFHTFSFGGSDDEIENLCQTITVEIAISPKALTQQRRKTLRFPGQFVMQSFDFSPLNLGRPVTFDTTQTENSDVFNVHVKQNITGSTDQLFSVVRYDFEIKLRLATNPIFQFEASLGYDFLTGGSLFLLLDKADSKGNPTCRYGELIGSVDNDEEETRPCKVGTGLVQNLNTIKTTLTFGNYSLWIFDRIGRRFRDDKAAERSPDPISFYLHIAQSHLKENPMSCDAQTLPETLNIAGMIDETGFLSFRQRVLLNLNEKKVESTKFTLKTPSLFRVWTEAHRVDIDFRISVDGKELARSVLGVMTEESLSLSLVAGKQYTLEMMYYGTYETIFCESILLEMMIQPKTPLYDFDFCTGHRQLGPETPNSMRSNTSMVTRYDYKNYSYHFWKADSNGNYPRNEIVYQKYLKLTRDTYLIGSLNSHFINGLTIQLNKIDEKSGRVFYIPDSGIVSKERNSYSVYSFLAANTTYRIQIKDLSAVSSPISGDKTAFNAFPHCAQYSLALYLSIFGSGNSSASCSYITIPSSLNDVKNLESSNCVHLNQVYRVPGTGYKTVKNVTFTVREKSLFKIAVEEGLIDNIDTDLELFEGKVRVAESATDLNLERIVYSLKPNTSYILSFTFYSDTNRRYTSCLGINVELEIAPLHDIPAVTCVSKLPPTTPIILGPFTPDSYVALDHEYSFQDRLVPFETKIPIIIDNVESMWVKADVTYDFLWSDLSVKIVNNDTKVTVAYGRNVYNSNEIIAVKLLRGVYNIIISEPDQRNLERISQHCTDFHLLLAFTPQAAPPQLEYEDVPCPHIFLPKVFDVVSYSHKIVNNTFHDQRNFRINPHKKEDVVKFTVTEVSYIRVFIPPFDVFDVDIQLDLVDRFGELIRKIGSSSKTHGEENLFAEIPAGIYNLRFKYFFVPKDKPCLAFPVELGVVTKKYYNDAFPTTSQGDCNTLSAANKAFVDAPMVMTGETKSYVFHQSSKNFTLSKTFKITKNMIFQATVDYFFFPGHVYMRLDGKNLISPYLSKPQKERIFPSKLGDSRAFFDHLLYPGEYTIVMDNAADESSLPFACPKFNFQYSLSSKIPRDYCDDADHLPTDLFSLRGGSKPYGGPSNATTGSVRVANDHFIIPYQNSDGYSTTHNILFKILKPSFIRVWAKADYVHNDIDFWFYTNETTREFVAAATGSGDVESTTLFLQPQVDPYLLVIKIIKRSKTSCNYFHFEFAVETNETVLDSKICPSPLPNPILPPREIKVLGDHFNMFGEDFVFSQDYVANNIRDFGAYRPAEVNYNISINVSSSLALTASIGFDFISTDFLLELHSASSPKVIHSVSGLSSRRGANFQSNIDTGIQKGVYFLIIKELIWGYQPGSPINRNLCEKFSLSLVISEIEDTTQFKVLSVNPPIGESLSTQSFLPITVEFTQSLKETVDYYDLVTENKAVYLKGSLRNTSTTVPPVIVHHSGGPSIFFAFLLPSGVLDNYALHFDATIFVNSNNTHAAPYNKTHIYSTLDCSCNNHGHCDADGEACVCTHPYVGTKCDACTFGYHKEGVNCVVNSFCKENTCNGHGDCEDFLNYPVCKCHRGYESKSNALCSICDDGYEGYPNCTLVDDTRAPGTRCTAPLLPLTLDTGAYLQFDEAVHLQGDYFLDAKHLRHDLEFTIKKTSLFRVYVEPHAVDIDLWLYSYNPVTQEKKLIDYGINSNGEETFFHKLDADLYILSFVYLTNGQQVDACATFNLELEIADVDKAHSIATRYQNVCAKNDVLPDVQKDFSIPEKPWEWGTAEPQQIFTVNTRPKGETSNIPFYNWTFVVPKMTNEVVLFELELAYRFLLGDIAVRLLQKTYGVGGEKWEESLFQGSGFNKYNKHYVSRLLKTGEYQVQLYVPATIGETSISACSPFTFSVKTKRVTKVVGAEDNVHCPHPEIIKNLDAVYLYDSRDEINLYETFFITKNTNEIDFKPAKDSLIRVRVTTVDWASIALFKVNGTDLHFITVAGDSDALFFDDLKVGESYKLIITISTDEDFDLCKLVHLQFALRPLDTLIIQQSDAYCPSSGLSVLPTFPTAFGMQQLPYANVNQTSYYSFRSFVNNGYVTQWRFNTSTPIIIEANLGSSFLIDNFYLEIAYLNRNQDISPSMTQTSTAVSLEHQFLIAYLPSGSYSLSIKGKEDQIYTSPDSPLFSQCSEFSFDVRVTEAEAWFTDNECRSAMVGQDIPTTLNSMYYLGNTGNVQVQSDDWWFPADVASHGMVEKIIKFTIDKSSLIRVYVEEHIIDIDIYLYNVSNHGNNDGRGDWKKVAQGLNMMGEESFVAEIPPGDYVISLIFINYGSSLPKCPRFNMEIAINELFNLPSLEKQCTPKFAVPSLFPQLPAVFSKQAGTFPYYKSFAGHYQQSLHPEADARFTVHSWNVKFDVISSVHIELGYNFLRNDLVLELKGKELSADGTVFLQYGKNKATRNVLNLNFVKPGEYTITVYEPIQNIQKYIHCAEFELFVRVHDPNPANNNMKQNTRFSQLFPVNFDSVEYLTYTDEMHVEDNFILVQENQASKTHTTNFSLRVDSFVHISISEGSPFQLQLTQGSTPLYYGKELAKRLSPGHYTLHFNLDDERGNQLVMALIQILIIPVNQLTQEINTFCAHSQKVWTPPVIAARPSDGYYHYNELHARLDIDKINQPSSTIFTQAIELTKSSIVSAQIWYNFKVTHLTLTLASIARPKDVVKGTDDYNHNTLNVLVPAGRYQFTINKAFNWDQQIPLNCDEFHFKISIKEEKDGHHPVDCSRTDQLPWNLDTVDGGSSKVGGPIQGGSLSLFSNEFLLNPLRSVLTTDFSLHQRTVMTLFISDSNYNSVDAFLIKNSSELLVIPFYSYYSTFQTIHFFDIDDASLLPSTHNYRIEFYYNPASIPASSPCPSFPMALFLRPHSRLEQTIQECSSLIPKQLPPKTVDFPAKENHVFFHVNSFFENTDIEQYKTSTGFYYPIEFSITKDALLDVSMTYAGSSSLFIIDLYYYDTPNSKWTHISSGDFGTVGLEQGDLSNILNTRLALSVSSRWRVAIEQSNEITKGLKFNQTIRHCLPYNLFFQLTGIGNGVTPTVRHIEPAEGDNFSPTRDLNIKMQFSVPLYDSNNVKITREHNVAMTNSIYLLSSNRSKVYPLYVTVPVGNPIPDDYTAWLFVFSQASFSHGETYELLLESGKLFSESGVAVSMGESRKYKMLEKDDRCSGHGTFDKYTQKCTCDLASHRTGDHCESCEFGFKKNENDECVRPPGCLPNSCGCRAQSTVSHCIPIGFCSGSVGDNGHITCSCPANFAGDRCQYCAVGFVDYPECKGDCNPPCGPHGKCNPSKKVCECDDKFAGETCTECALGYTGDACDITATTGIFKIIGITIVGVILILIAVVGGWFVKRRYDTQQALALTEDILMDGLGTHQSETVDLSDQSTTDDEGVQTEGGDNANLSASSNEESF